MTHPTPQGQLSLPELPAHFGDLWRAIGRWHYVPEGQGKDLMLAGDAVDDEVRKLMTAYAQSATESLRAEAEALRKAMDMLAGLHTCLTTDEPMAMAEAIFDHVQAEQSALREEIASHERAAEAFRTELARLRALSQQSGSEVKK